MVVIRENQIPHAPPCRARGNDSPLPFKSYQGKPTTASMRSANTIALVAQNIYDDDGFFEGYSELPRSVKGLDGAPE